MSLTQYFAFACFAALTLNILYAKPHCPGNVASLTLRNVQGSLIVGPVGSTTPGPVTSSSAFDACRPKTLQVGTHALKQISFVRPAKFCRHRPPLLAKTAFARLWPSRYL
jgi:hypothetical protein